jgi:hypothetical protein
MSLPDGVRSRCSWPQLFFSEFVCKLALMGSSRQEAVECRLPATLGAVLDALAVISTRRLLIEERQRSQALPFA